MNKKLFFDGDSVMHLVASASEKRSIEVTHPSMGAPIKFKTRTLFWGSKRDKSGGWLGAFNEERVSNGGEAYKPEEFTIKDIQTPEPVAHCLSSAKRYILNICDKLDCYDYDVFVGEGETFREQILMPEGRRYKQNRDGIVRSLYVNDVKDYLIKHHDAKVIKDTEVDDYLAEIGYSNYLRIQEHGDADGDMDIIIARDKDAMGCEGWLFNPDKMTRPFYVHGFGRLWVDSKGKIRGVGRKFKYFQLLFGDSVDHYNPRLILGETFRYGEKSIFKDLDPLTTDKECWKLIVDKYKSFLPESITYKTWSGTKESDNWLTWLQKHFTLVHMRRFEGDSPQVVDILNKLGVDFT